MKRSIKHISVAISLLIFATAFLACEKAAQRKKQEYSSRIKSLQAQGTAFEGETFELQLRIVNRGKAEWEPSGKNPFFLSYHLLDEDKKVLKYENPRFSFPQKVSPGQAVEMTIKAKAPLKKGKYILEFDLVREGIAWFKDYGSETLRVPLLVSKKEWPEDRFALDLEYGKYTKFQSSLAEFNELFKLIRITLNHNEVEFRGKKGKILGFQAGSGYPQIWLRDANTIIPASRFFYDENWLRSWLTEHLAYQKSDGALEDWIDSQGNSDKNTTETDQEASAVEAAYQISELIGTQWLETKIGEESVIGKLEKALNFVLTQRYDGRYGLVKGAHTADWGDVDMNEPDQKAIYVDEKTHWTADIYDQSMIYQACENLASIFESLSQRKKSSFWQKKADLIKRRTQKWLWQEKKGFYRVHLHLDSLVHAINEQDIFALGGNTQAILSGLADEKKSKRIIEQALSRQKSFGLSTISGVLLPPYPKNFFKHPMMDDPFEYQNGGQWDWFGGKIVHSMFEHGFSSQAREKLLEIARKNIANGGFFEWDSRDGTGKGSDYYSGSAGSLSKALIEGYFGINVSTESLHISPKLSQDEAKVHFYLPAADLFVAYDYRFSKDKKRLFFDYNSNFPLPGKLRILNPWPDSKLASTGLLVMKDGVRIPFIKAKNNQDEFIVIETDFKKHSLLVKMEMTRIRTKKSSADGNY